MSYAEGAAADAASLGISVETVHLPPLDGGRPDWGVELNTFLTACLLGIDDLGAADGRSSLPGRVSPAGAATVIVHPP